MPDGGARPELDDAAHTWPWVLAVAAVATLPYLELVAANRRETLSGIVAWWWLGTLAMGLGILMLASRMAGAAGLRRAATFLVPMLWLFFHQPAVNSVLGTLRGLPEGSVPARPLLTWSLVASVVAVPMVVLSRMRIVQVYAVALSLVALGPPSIELALWTPPDSAGAPVATAPVDLPALQARPNIYIIVPDGYARADVIRVRRASTSTHSSSSSRIAGS